MCGAAGNVKWRCAQRTSVYQCDVYELLSAVLRLAAVREVASLRVSVLE
jgi:hypothetical protein